MVTGGASATSVLDSGSTVQFVGLPGAGVMMGVKAAATGRWVTVMVRDPERFGTGWDTVKGMKAWVAAYDAAAGEET